MESGLRVAKLAGRSRPEVLACPASRRWRTDPGYAIWKRDFDGACGLFAIILNPEYREEDRRLLRLRSTLFGMGYSWGGFESLAIPFDCSGLPNGNALESRRPRGAGLHIGLEDPDDLIEDLAIRS
jgi:cystathionine beta-lyase